jgi:hypothetical protein
MSWTTPSAARTTGMGTSGKIGKVLALIVKLLA